MEQSTAVKMGCFVDKVGRYKDEDPYDYCYMQEGLETENCVFAKELCAQGKTKPTDCQHWRPVEGYEQALLSTKDAQRLELLNSIAHAADSLSHEYNTMITINGGEHSKAYGALRSDLTKLATLNKEPSHG